MAHQCRRPIANVCVVSKSTIGLIRGETLWVGANISGDGGWRARVRQHSGVVAVARGGIPAYAFIKGETVYVLQLLGCRDNK
jgi:hypothetical protein